jgi:hypothetical protein
VVAEAGADLEHLPAGLDVEQVGHQRHHERLGYGLVAADRQRAVGVGQVLELGRHEVVARHFGHRGEHPAVEAVAASTRRSRRSRSIWALLSCM